jgi:membrane protein required for colicin V production
MHNLDVVLIILILLAMINGFRKGFITSVTVWAALILSVILVIRLGPSTQSFLIGIGTHPTFSFILAVLLILVLVAIVGAAVRLALNKLAKALKLSFLNRIAGSVLGFCSVIAFLTIFLHIILLMLPFTRGLIEIFSQSFIMNEVTRFHGFISGIDG